MSTSKPSRLKRTMVKQPHDLRSEYESALGRLVIDFALMHYLLERMGWTFWGLHPEFAQILTKDLPIKHLVEKLLASLKEIELEEEVQDELTKILKEVQALSEKRNTLLHALWVFEEGKPVLCHLRRAKAPEETAPAITEIENPNNAIVEAVGELLAFDKNNCMALIAPIAIAQKNKYGQQPASTS